ncbi:MAG: hypothetical protein ACTSUE_12055 [Promethearchaeota archaeon]
MKIRLIISTKSPKKRAPLSLKLAIPPTRHRGFNEFVKAAIAGKSDVIFTFDTIQKTKESLKRESKVRGVFKFHPTGRSSPERINQSAAKFSINYNPQNKYRIVLKSKSPKTNSPIELKLKVPGSKSIGFINLINAALKNDSLVKLHFELIAREKHEDSKVAGNFYLFLR